LAFASQENILHEQLMALNAEITAARQGNVPPEQWEAVLPLLVEVCDAVARFRAGWRDIMGPQA
jgi:hypothetical protein